MKFACRSFLFLSLPMHLPAHASLSEPQSAWNKKSVKVCWGSVADVQNADLPKLSKLLIQHSEYESLDNHDRSQVKETITREYNLENAGIELIGWENCTKNDAADVIVFTEDLTKKPKRLTDFLFVSTYSGCSSIGDDSPGSVLKKFVHIKKLPDQQLRVTSAQALDLIALHEFGHLMGLRHEHARMLEADQDSNCRSQGVALLEMPGKSAKTFASYDPNSIMNYCHDFSLMNKTGIDFYVEGLSDFSLSMSAGENRFNINEVNFTDKSLVTKTPDISLNAVRYQIKIGLSKSDRHTLKCMYDSSYDQKNCNPGFMPDK